MDYSKSLVIYNLSINFKYNQRRKYSIHHCLILSYQLFCFRLILCINRTKLYAAIYSYTLNKKFIDNDYNCCLTLHMYKNSLLY